MLVPEDKPLRHELKMFSLRNLLMAILSTIMAHYRRFQP
jgi:hypothetical protein